MRRRNKRGGTSTGGRPRIGRPSLGLVISAPAGAPPSHQPATSVPRRPLGTGLPTACVAGPYFACGEMGHIRLRCPKMAAVSAVGNRKWYPFDGDCEYSVPLGRGMKYVEGKIESSDSPCLGAALQLFDVVGSGAAEAKHYCDKGLVIPSLFPLLREEISVNAVNKPLTPLIRDDLRALHETAEVVTATYSVKGRLQRDLSFWREELQASPFILQTIESGYVLLLKSEPTPFSRKNQNSALQNYKFVKESIADLLATGCVEVVAEPPHVCSPLSVVENSAGKKRLVPNLRHVNKFLWKQKFKYKDL